MTETVNVSCSFAPGIHIFGPEHGQHHLVKGVLSSLPAEVWNAWLARHQDHVLVTSRSIYEVSRG